MTIIPELREAVIDGQAKLAVTKVTQGLEQGIPAETLLQDGLIAAMKEVGQLFEEHEIYVPEMLVAARAMNAAVDVLKPQLVEHEAHPSGTVAIGTVKGDLHDIGKNLVAMMLEGRRLRGCRPGHRRPAGALRRRDPGRSGRGGHVGAAHDHHDEHERGHGGDQPGRPAGTGSASSSAAPRSRPGTQPRSGRTDTRPMPPRRCARCASC